MTNTREFDVVLFGATGYTGQLVADHLAAHGGGARLALAGRNRERLQHVCSEIRSSLPLLVGDSQDPAFVTQLAQRAKVVCTTVGPYSLYGERLVAACVDQGTSYCDLTGEVNFVRNMIDRYEERARQSGARIVHSCGFDSIPSDLGTFYLQEQARAGQSGSSPVQIPVRFAHFDRRRQQGSVTKWQQPKNSRSPAPAPSTAY